MPPQRQVCRSSPVRMVQQGLRATAQRSEAQSRANGILRSACDVLDRGAIMADDHPDPEKLDLVVHYCRTCRLLIERFRLIASAVERDPEILREAVTCDMLQELSDALHKHTTDTNHTPTVEATRALLDACKRARAGRRSE